MSDILPHKVKPLTNFEYRKYSAKRSAIGLTTIIVGGFAAVDLGLAGHLFLVDMAGSSALAGVIALPFIGSYFISRKRHKKQTPKREAFQAKAEELRKLLLKKYNFTVEDYEAELLLTGKKIYKHDNYDNKDVYLEYKIQYARNGSPQQLIETKKEYLGQQGTRDFRFEETDRIMFPVSELNAAEPQKPAQKTINENPTTILPMSMFGESK